MDMTRSKISTLIEKVEASHSSMKANDRVRALGFIKNVPLRTQDMKRLSTLSDDVDFGPAYAAKTEQRYQDVEDAMTHAAEAGAENLDEFCAWLDLRPGSGFDEIVDKAHLYGRVGQKGRPETAVLPD